MRRYLAYFGYVMQHKWWVLVAGLRITAPLLRLLRHDLSKFRPGEFVAYAKAFYAPDGKRWPMAEDPGFDRAWASHIRSNDHHWQHWVLMREGGTAAALEMPVSAILEMIADWMGAGRAITGKWDYLTWYKAHRSDMILHPATREFVDRTLGAWEGGSHG